MKKSVKELLEENSRLEKQLAPENQQVLTDIVAYLRGSSAPTDRQEQVLGLNDALEAVVGELLDGLRSLVKVE